MKKQNIKYKSDNGNNHMNDLLEKIRNDPYARLLGISVDKVEQNQAVCSVKITEDMLNFLGAIHGGLVFTLADVAFAAAGNYGQPLSFALDISGPFLKTAKVGDVIGTEARMINSTKRTGLYRTDVFNNNQLIATFNGTVFHNVN